MSAAGQWSGKDPPQLSRLAALGDVVRIAHGRYDVPRSLHGIVRYYAERAAGREAKNCRSIEEVEEILKKSV